jgi:FixJ family two-component response regulator
MNAAGSPSVFIIDDDASVRASIQGLLKSVFITGHGRRLGQNG